MSSQTRRVSTQALPQYERPSYPMNPAAQRALVNLARTHDLSRLDKRLEDAQKYLSDAAVDINDRLTSRETAAKKLRERQESRGQIDDDEGNIEPSLIEQKADGMTERLDHAIRKIIDAQHSVQSIKNSIDHAAEDARVHASTQASTQIPRSSRRGQATQGTAQEFNDVNGNTSDAEDAYPDFTPTDPTSGTQQAQSILHTFQQRIEGDKIRYQNHSLTERYANNNAYRDFRRIVHDARNPDGNVPMPHQSEWFNEGIAPPPGVTGRDAENNADADDDDIAVSKAIISTRCPLTLQEFKEPLTSKKCPHTFETAAIHDMIRQNQGRAIVCPVPGCRETLQRKDLHVDAVLIRKIQRIQRARQMEDEDDEDVDGSQRLPHGTQSNAQIIDDFDENDDDDEITNFVSKAEPRSTAA